MVLLGVAISLIALVLWVYCLFDAVSTPAEDCRRLPKPLWVVIVLVAPIGGSILWLLVGRPEREFGVPWWSRDGADRPGRHRPRPRGTASTAPLGPDDDPDFLRRLERRLDPENTGQDRRPDEDD